MNTLAFLALPPAHRELQLQVDGELLTEGHIGGARRLGVGLAPARAALQVLLHLAPDALLGLGLTNMCVLLTHHTHMKTNEHDTRFGFQHLMDITQARVLLII